MIARHIDVSQELKCSHSHDNQQYNVLNYIDNDIGLGTNMGSLTVLARINSRTDYKQCHYA